MAKDSEACHYLNFGKAFADNYHQTFRKLNAKTVPNLVKVPKTEEEDKKMVEERERNAGQQ
jgi:hypothetical protein